MSNAPLLLIQVHTVYSQPSPTDQHGKEYHSQGHLDSPLLSSLIVEGLTSCNFYLCGPPSFLRSIYFGLRSSGVEPSRVFYEYFATEGGDLEEELLQEAAS